MGKEPLREQGGGEASTCARVGHRARVRRAVISGGASEFGEAKLLEALLFYCVPRVDTAPLAKLLLARFGTLRGVLNAGREELEAVNGVKEYASAFFLLLRELLQREGGAFGAANFLDPDSVRIHYADTVVPADNVMLDQLDIVCGKMRGDIARGDYIVLARERTAAGNAAGMASSTRARIGSPSATPAAVMSRH